MSTCAFIRDAQKRRAKQDLEAKLLDGLQGPAVEMTLGGLGVDSAGKRSKVSPAKRSAHEGHRPSSSRSTAGLDCDLPSLCPRGQSTNRRPFPAATERTFQRLSGMPGIGMRYRHDHPALAELRVSPRHASRSTWSSIARSLTGSKSSVYCMVHATQAASWPRNSALRRMPATTIRPRRKANDPLG